MEEGKRYLFYDSLSGEILINEARNRAEIMPTIERVIEIYPVLHGRAGNSYSVKVLNFSDYEQDFDASVSCRVIPETEELEFTYPDPNHPAEPQPYIKPLSEAINEQMDYLVDVDFRLSLIELGL